MTASLLASILTLTNLCGSVSVDTFGARVVSYAPAGGGEVLFVSETGTGGIPLCWPWFAGLGPEASARHHGIARYRDFEVVSTNGVGNETTLALRLVSDDETRRLFPHDFALTVRVRLSDRLTLSMTGENTGCAPFAVTEAFHPYFAVPDSRTCRVEALEAPEYRLVPPGVDWALAFSDEGARGRYVWQPDERSHLSKTVAPLAPGDWRKFVCVESGTLRKEDAYILKPGESHTLVRTIRLLNPRAESVPPSSRLVR